MGTRGYKGYRYRGRYWVTFNRWDSYPEGLGLDLLQTIPTDREEFLKWLEKMKETFDEEYATWKKEDHSAEDPDDRAFRYEHPKNDLFIEWVYVIDLDNLVFHIDTRPVFALEHMPSEEKFCDWIGLDNYSERSYAFKTPKEYRYEAALVKSIPPLTADMIDKFTAIAPKIDSWESLVAMSTLGTSQNLSSLILTELAVGSLATRSPTVIFDWRATGPDNTITDYQREFAHSLIAVCIAPKRWDEYGAVPNSLRRGGGVDEHWWPTDNICVLLGSQIDNEAILKKSVVEVINVIRKAGPKGTAFGIISSVIHVAVVRVDGDDVRYTSALGFIPSSFATTSATEGISALASLGYLALRECMSRKINHRFSSRPETAPNETLTLTKYPYEIIEQILVHLPYWSLLAFASVSEQHLDLALPLFAIPCTISTTLTHPISPRPDPKDGRFKPNRRSKLVSARFAAIDSWGMQEKIVELRMITYTDRHTHTASTELFGGFQPLLEVKSNSKG